MGYTPLTAVAEAVGARVDIEHFTGGTSGAATVVVLGGAPDAATRDAILTAASNHRIVVTSADPDALHALGIPTSKVPSEPSANPLVAKATHAVIGVGIADGLRLEVAAPLGLSCERVWAVTRNGTPIAGQVRVGDATIGVLAGRWDDASAEDDGALLWTRVLLGETDPDLESDVVTVLGRPGPEVEHPPLEVIDGSGWQVPEFHTGEINSLGFLREVAHAGRTLPVAVYEALVDFADEAPPAGAMLIENMPLGDLPPTPDDPLKAHAAKTDRVSEFALLTVGRVIGRPVGYLPEHGGDVVQNISPTRKNADRQVSTSSKTMLEFHTEAAFHPYRPRYLLLLALRGDPQAATTLCSIAAVLETLSPRARAALFQPRFTTGIDESYAGGRSATRSEQRPVLSGDPEAPKLCLDADLMAGTDPVAQRALDELARLVREHATSVTLKAGDLLVVDNDVAVHGRTPFTPRFDGTDRWLQRTFVVADHTAADGSRSGHVITTEFIA